MNKLIRIGTRASALALWQAHTLQDLLNAKGYATELVPIKSDGDLDLVQPLYEIGTVGIFTKTLDAALLNNRIDIAIHSMKDVPTQLPEGLKQAAVLKRGPVLDDLVKKAKPTSKANYLAFETLYDPEQMIGQRNRRLGGGINYPYLEGLRIDEAMNPLALMSVGLYGKTLPPQNGAPIRLVVPWKYGFKSIKSVVGIKFVEKQPPTTWNILAANEYGFYANVNPAVDHPRWSQASERRITTGGIFDQNRIATLPFNGYGEEVAGLYSGMNLRKYY